MKYVLKFKITNNKTNFHEFSDYKSAKEIYIALQYNLTIKAGKLYEVNGKRKTLIEKFNKKVIVPLNYDKTTIKNKEDELR